MLNYIRIIPFFLTLLFAPLFSEVIEREGGGFLEKNQGQLVLHLKGNPYERGFQHGKLLKHLIQSNISTFIESPKPGFSERSEAFVANLPILLTNVPWNFQDEMRGMADGSDIPLHKIVMLNLFPEMFHCNGVTVTGDATSDGSLYHVRVLEYAVGKSLQKTAVLMVVEPEDKYAYLNVSYAGFIGSVTGMNNQKISVGEIGGLGYGKWDGVPMAFLIRQILENASTLEEAKQILTEARRTCEYYYILADGKDNSSVAVYATPSQIRFIEPGATYALFAASDNVEKDEKLVVPSWVVESSPFQTVLLDENKKLTGLIHRQPKDCLLQIGFASPERYPPLAERVLAKYGMIGPLDLIEIIKKPVSKNSDLHNAIFKPAELKVWIAHAGPNDEPAYDQPYFSFSLSDLLQR